MILEWKSSIFTIDIYSCRLLRQHSRKVRTVKQTIRAAELLLLLMACTPFVLIAGCHKLSNAAMAPTGTLSATDKNSEQMALENNQLLSETMAQHKNDDLKSYLDQRPDLARKTFAGCTPMFAAAMFANAEAVQILIDHGADVNALSASGESPLDRAESSKADAVIALLKQHGARNGTMRK